MSLRSRLIIGLLVLTAVGLLVADAATYGSLRSFLLDRVDQQLDDARQPVAVSLGMGGFDRMGPGLADHRGGPRRELPPGTYGEVRRADGTVIDRVGYGFADTATAPALPAKLPGSGATGDVRTFDAGEYRVRAEAIPGGTLVVAVPLRDVHQTITRLLWIEGLVTAAVLAALAGLGWSVVRLGLRPLERMEATADNIAAGDLSHRVEPADPRTEVGRLGLSLNAMLDRLERAFAERQASEDRLRRFLADASHELRTPLTSIRGYAELFRRGADRRPEDLAKSMRRIEDEATRMGVLVDDLLLLARLDEGRPLAASAPVDLAAIAADAASDARAADPDRAVTVEAPAPVLVAGDDGRLRQVAANLVANALTHTPAGTPVEIRAGVDGGEAVLSVTDHGPGMTQEVAERVFERFYRADPSRARTSGGAGLGLAIVAAIAEAHGGRAEVHSALGHGATFSVRLPLRPPG